jgi:ribose transport system substrate-binding protein
VLSRRALSVALSGALLSSCHRDRRKRIAVIPKSTQSIYWISVHEGADQAAKEFNVEVLWNGAPAETDIARQIQIVESMVAQRVDGIAIAAAQKQALVSSVERAIATGIPVTVFDSGLDIDDYTAYVATDNAEAGRLGARTLADLLQGKGVVAMVSHAPGSASTMDRENGFREVITRDYPGIRIVGEQFGMSDPSKSRAAAENLLTAHSEINGIFASSEPSTLGAALAISSRGLNDKVTLVGFDASDALINDLRGGAIKALIVQDPHKMGYEAVRTVVQKLRGETPQKRLDLAAVAVRKQDLDKPEIRKLLSLS